MLQMNNFFHRIFNHIFNYDMDFQKQKVEGIENSTINQAGRDIIVTGIGYKDVTDICQDVVRQELNIVTNVALRKFKNDLEEYTNELILRIQKEANSSELIQKFQSPDIHFPLHDSIRSYSSVKDKNQKEIIVDTMIDRLKTEETDVEKFIIDEAISILPRINKRIGLLLVAMFRRNIINPGYEFAIENLLKKIPEELSDISNITKLDISYMEQLGCVNNLQGTQQYKPYEELLLNNYDLYFRKYPTYAILEDFLDNHKILANSIINVAEGFNASIFIKNAANDKFSVILTNHDEAKKLIARQAGQEYLCAFEEFLKIAPLMSVHEVKEHLIKLNPRWESLLYFLNSEKIKGYDLSPVGRFIANIIHSKLFHINKMSLTDMY